MTANAAASGRTRSTQRLVLGTIMAAVLLGAVFAGQNCWAQTGGRAFEDKTITPAIQKEIIDSVCMALDTIYVFPDVATKMGKFLRGQYKKNAYAKLTSTREFTQQLTQDLQSISHDRHLRVGYLSDEEINRMVNDTITDDARMRGLRERQRGNFGWKELKLMPGNVGYVDLRGFSAAEDAGGTAIAAMNFLTYTDAIIFDLRQNGGGSPSMIQLISSYLFDEPKHLNSFYIRHEDTVEQFWTQAYVQGPKMVNTDVYVLTSHRTFSAAEEFTYNLKNMKRATIVGDTTGGGAHPVDGQVFPNLNIQMAVPFGRAINPITGTNWEGTGVAPDIVVPSDNALDVAYMEALKKIRDRRDEEDRFEVDWVLQDLEVKAHPVAVDMNTLSAYVGDYGPRSLRLEDGGLMYQRGENPPMKMIPMSNTLFRFDEIGYFRLEVVLDDAGKPVELVGHYDNGTVDKSPRTN